MKNKAKRIVSAVCALAMCAAMLPAAAFAEGNTSEAAETPSTMSIFDWLKDRTVEVGDSIQIEGSASIFGVHSWEVCDGDGDCVTLSNTSDRTVTVTGVREGVVVLRHVITGVRTEYVKICVQAGSTTPNPDPDPVEGEGIYFYVAMPNNEVLSSNASDYRFLTYGGAASNLASHEMEAVTNTVDESAITQYIDTFPTGLNEGYPASNSSPTSAKLDGENNSWTIDPETGEVSDFSFTIGSTTYTDEEYGLRWAKFSYAYTTDVVGNAYHADAQLYEKITIESVLDDLNPEKVVTDFVLNTDGTELEQGTFAFVLSDSTGNKVADLTATVTEENVETKIELAADAASTTVLTPGEYTITETQDDLNAWEEADSIIFTVASDGSVTVNNGSDKVITNTPATYTVEYDDGVPGEEIVVPASSNHKYNEHTAVNDSTPARDGYTFQGWDADNNDTVDYEAGASITITGDVTLTAIWAAQEPTDPEEPTDPGITPSEDNVELNKTATGLDANDQSDVTLSIGATEDQDDVAVLFVLDYSTSVDVRQEAEAMLKELAGKENTNVKVGVVNYWADAQTGEWVTMTPDTELSDLLTSPGRSGTNLHAGLLEAQEMLADPAIDGYETYLITISDGITYLWTDESSGETKSVWFQNIGNGPNDIQNGNDVYAMKYHGAEIPADTFKALTSGTEEIVQKYEKTITKMETYATSIKPDPSVTERYWALAEDGVMDSTLIGSEIAIYKVAAVYKELLNSVDHAYALKLDEGNWSNYPYGEQLMDYLAEQDGGGAISATTAKEVFAGIRDQILYAIEKGTVTDVIGDDFDVAGLDSFVLTVGGVEVPGTVNSNTISFGDKYTVTYYPDGTSTDAREQFVWAINTPVENANPVKLTYTVKLVNKAAEPGDYTVPANEEAVLEYTSSNGGSGSEEFPVPKVTYNVPETSTTVTTPKPDEHPDIAEGIANGTWGGKPTATPAPSSTIPQTGDDLPLGLLIVVAIAAAGAAGGLIVLRKRSKQ